MPAESRAFCGHVLVVLCCAGNTAIMRFCYFTDHTEDQMRRVVVTGMGIVSSIGDNVDEVRESIKLGRSGITFSPEMAEMGFRSQVYGKPKLDPFPHIDRRIARFMGEGSAWNYIAMEEAIAMAKLPQCMVSSPKTGIIMGSGGPSVRALARAHDLLREHRSTKKIGPTEVPKAMSSTASATLATPFGIKGVNHTISAACATSAICIGSAYEQIQWGKQDIVFAGGSEELDVDLSSLFDAMGAMSSKYNDAPHSASRAYDINRDGFVIAGGAGVLVLEELEHARERNAPIFGEIVGYGHSSDGKDMVVPSGEGAMRCMRMALQGLHPTSISYVNTHGTATPKGDGVELEAIMSVFGSDPPPVSSSKSLAGHSLGAVSAQEAIHCLLMLQDDFIMESAHIETLDPALPHVPVVQKRIDNAGVRRVLSNSFGFGGTNASLVFERFGA